MAASRREQDSATGSQRYVSTAAALIGVPHEIVEQHADHRQMDFHRAVSKSGSISSMSAATCVGSTSSRPSRFHSHHSQKRFSAKKYDRSVLTLRMLAPKNSTNRRWSPASTSSAAPAPAPAALSPSHSVRIQLTDLPKLDQARQGRFQRAVSRNHGILLPAVESCSCRRLTCLAFLGRSPNGVPAIPADRSHNTFHAIVRTSQSPPIRNDALAQREQEWSVA